MSTNKIWSLNRSGVRISGGRSLGSDVQEKRRSEAYWRADQGCLGGEHLTVIVGGGMHSDFSVEDVDGFICCKN